MEYAKIDIAIGAIANFFGGRMGIYSDVRLFGTFGITNVPGRNKAERISYVLRDTYRKDKYIFEQLLDSLVKYHKLSKEDFENLNKILVRIGYTVKEGKVVHTLPREIVEPEAKPFDAYQQIGKILSLATREVKIIDPYVDERLFPLYFHGLPPNVNLRILTKRMLNKFKIVAEKFKIQKSNFEVRRSTEIHDRYLIIDQRVWTIGQSIKDAGIKPLYIIEIQNVKTVEKMFYDLWARGVKII